VSLVLVPLDADADAAGLARDLAPGFGGDEAPALALLEQTFALLTRDPRPHPWGCYLAEIDGQAIGTCAFKSAPTGAGEVELAYMTFPAFEGRGHATAMAGALARIADAGGAMPIAHTLPEENASNKALRRNGFAFAGEVEDPEDGLVWRWERRLDQ
jgi:RimJ/RimL family protein N-acetyltransferase